MDFLKKAAGEYMDSRNNNNNDSNDDYSTQGQTNEGNNQEGGDFGVTGGSRFNQPASQNSSGGFGGVLGQFMNQDDAENAVAHADNESGSSGDRDLFGTAMGFLKSGNADVESDIDEGGVQDAHQQAYAQGNASNLDANSMGAAAALNALKKYTGAGASGGGSTSGSAAGGQSALIGMAMSEASKLFDQSGGAASGGKQDVVNSAAQTIMKFMLKSQMSGMMGTGGGAGGMGSLVSMASKFM